MTWWKIVLCAFYGAAIGSINPSYLIGRLRGFDIRKEGSGNAGASNAVILMGKIVGLFCTLFDIGKAFAAFRTAPLIFGQSAYFEVIAGTACILGHIFPFYMKFRGGKGLAALGGVILAVDWRLFLIMLGAEILFAVAVDYICVVPISACVIFPLLYGFLGDAGTAWLRHAGAGWWGALIFGAAAIAMLYRHVENVRRIRAGTEMHLSYLWKHDKEGEIERIRQNREK